MVAEIAAVATPWNGSLRPPSEELEKFWKKISDEGAKGPLQPSWIDKALNNHNLDYSPVFMMMDIMSRIMSPYELNPMNVNPLRKVLESSIDFNVLREGCPVKLFLSATNVRTGKPKVFRREELTVDALLASACLPNVFKAIEIDGEAYWDGGYLGNPALWPLYHERSAADIILVQLNPLYRAEIPTTVSDIMNRLNEISFNASLMSEMRAIDFVQRLLEGGRLEQPRYRRLFLHSIEDEPRMRAFKLSTKFNGDWDFLQTLRQYGHEAADHFLTHSSAQIGRESTLDIQRYL
jgi:NTE family protein